jgi:hypothetical protein
LEIFLKILLNSKGGKSKRSNKEKKDENKELDGLGYYIIAKKWHVT